MNNTKMTGFKYGLYAVKTSNNYFTGTQIEDWTLIESINDCVEKLLNDEEMMHSKNDYTFEQRSMLTSAKLFEHLFQLASSENIDEFKATIKEFKRILNTSQAFNAEYIGLSSK